MTQSGVDTSTAALLPRRLGHFHSHGIRRMITHKAVKGSPLITISNVPCQACFQGKQSRASIPKLRTSESTQVLQLIHSDVASPFRVKSLGGSSYFLTFIDDYSKKTWVYFLAHKYECLDKFKIFHKEVENDTGKKSSHCVWIMEANIFLLHGRLITGHMASRDNFLNLIPYNITELRSAKIEPYLTL
jgi:hypothetical protein